MRYHPILKFITMFLLLLSAVLPVRAFGETGDRIRVDYCLMDDYGSLLQDYRSTDFVIDDGRFVFREAPRVEGYRFATANILKLETEAGISYRVNYFYTQEDQLPGLLPDPVPLSELPMKRTQVERRRVFLSWIDQSGKELMDSTAMDLDFIWETFVLPEPEELRGFQFDSLRTGQRFFGGESLPHIAFVYAPDGPARIPPSLIFEHLLEPGSIRTIPREQLPEPATSPEPVTTSHPPTTPVITPPVTTPTGEPNLPGQSEAPPIALLLVLLLGGSFIAATWWKRSRE